MDYPHLLNKHFHARDELAHSQDEHEDEDAWLASVIGTADNSLHDIKGLAHGNLIIEMSDPMITQRTSKPSVR